MQPYYEPLSSGQPAYIQLSVYTAKEYTLFNVIVSNSPMSAVTVCMLYVQGTYTHPEGGLSCQTKHSYARFSPGWITIVVPKGRSKHTLWF